MACLPFFIAVALLSVMPAVEPLVTQAGESGAAAGHKRAKTAIYSQHHSRRIGRCCHYSALRRDHGTRWVRINL